MVSMGTAYCRILRWRRRRGTAWTELEESLEAERLAGLDADGTLAEAVCTRRAERRAQARQLVLAAHWADLHAVLPRPWVTTPGCERLVRLGGDGTPEVAEFAPAELGASSGSATARRAVWWRMRWICGTGSRCCGLGAGRVGRGVGGPQDRPASPSPVEGGGGAGRCQDRGHRRWSVVGSAADDRRRRDPGRRPTRRRWMTRSRRPRRRGCSWTPRPPTATRR